jgi:flagellar basal body-associated protein FliL
VSDDKKKDADPKAEEGKKKKKGLPPIVMIAVGAIVGGAGVVFAIPPKTVEVKVEEPVYEIVDVKHPDKISVTFNPRTKAGKGTARCVFKFTYRVREDLEDQAFEQVKANWEQAGSNALMLLRKRSMEELQSETGMQILAADMIAELDRTIFAGADPRIAKVANVIWIEWLFQ